MVPPTPAEVRTALPNFGWAERAVGVGSPGDATLQGLIDEAVSYVTLVTWRPIDSTMPAVLAPIAKRAIVLRVAQDVMGGEDAYIETVNDDAIVSFSIGPYSETRAQNKGWHGNAEAPFGGSLNPWAPLNQALWLLLSLAPGETNAQVDERRAYWRSLLANYNQPAFGLQEVDWTNGLSGRGIPSTFGLPGPTLDIPDPVI